MPVGSYFLEALDTSGQTKDAQYIANFMLKHINSFEPGMVTGVCMDGACIASFPLINAMAPHVFTYICPAHSIDNFLKNVCSDKAVIRVKSLDRDFDWDEDEFSDCIDQVWDAIKFVLYHQKALARYRALADEVPRDKRPVGGTELLRYVDTRFASKVLMLIRYRNVLPILDKLFVDNDFTKWASKQSRDVKDKAATAKRTVRDESIIDTVKTCIRVLEPAVVLLRMLDGKDGATLGKIYGYTLQVDAFYKAPIKGLHDRLRKKIHTLFMARWEYFHVPVMTAAYRFEPEYCRRDFTPAETKEVRAVLRQMSNSEHPYTALLSDLADYEEALACQSYDLSEEYAFSENARKMTSYKWAKVYLAPWKHLCWAAMRLLSMHCSASGCEHAWSVEGWIHSKKRNRLGQKTVERLVRSHTNLLLESQLDEWQSAMLPWELEMIPADIDEAEADSESE
eukprot:scaffold163838_cov37-Tisochrysis_lutea.AAC.1